MKNRIHIITAQGKCVFILKINERELDYTYEPNEATIFTTEEIPLVKETFNMFQIFIEEN